LNKRNQWVTARARTAQRVQAGGEFTRVSEVPIDVAMIKGDYYLHAESNPRSSMPVDAFNWGEEKPLCVEPNDFRIPDGDFCKDRNTVVKFNKVDKSWGNHNKIEVRYSKRSYQNKQLVKVAGTQCLLSMLG
jgi:hypothetical protein